MQAKVLNQLWKKAELCLLLLKLWLEEQEPGAKLPRLNAEFFKEETKEKAEREAARS